MRKYVVDGDTLIIPPNSRKPYTGKAFSLYKDGTKEEEGKYRNGLKDGKWTSWFENGQRRYEGTYKDGIKVGLWTERRSNVYRYYNNYYQNDGVYKDGIRVGKWTGLYIEYHPNRQKKLEKMFRNRWRSKSVEHYLLTL